MSIIAQFLAGLLFAAGLILSGMVDPAKVQGFLDLAGQWDPSLAFVMVGAVTTTAIGYRLVLRRKQPLLGGSFHLPPTRGLEPRLVVGAAMFGVGWGLGGLCPGPAITSLGIGSAGVFAFVPAMLAGMAAARWLSARRPTQQHPASAS